MENSRVRHTTWFGARMARRRRTHTGDACRRSNKLMPAVIAALVSTAGSTYADVEIETAASAALSSDQGAPVVATDIRAIASGGYWESDGRSGRVRVIVVEQGQDQLSSRVYLEWLEESPDEPMRRVGTASIGTINESPRWSVGQPAMQPSPTGLQIELPATELGSEEPRNFVLRVPIEGTGAFEVQ